MTGPLDIAFSGADLSIREPIRKLPRTDGERFDAEVQALHTDDSWFNITGARRRLWSEALDALHSATGERLANPYGDPHSGYGLEFGETVATQEAKRKAAATEKMRLAREQYPDLPDPELIDFRIAQSGRYTRERRDAMVDAGGGLGAFGGNVVGASIRPEGLVTAIFPPSRLALLPAQASMRGFLGSVGREALLQAGIGATSQAAGEVLDYAARSPIGTEQTLSEALQNVLGAAVGGAVLGGGIRGLHEAWRRLRPEVRAAAPSDVRDAATAIERQVLDDEATQVLPGGLAGPTHERILGEAGDAVARGQAVRLLGQERARIEREMRGAPGAAPDAPSMVTFIRDLGGIKDEGGALKAMDLQKRFPGMVNNRTGISLDYMREALEEAGYLRSKVADQTTDIADLLDALDRTSRGETIYPHGQTRHMADAGTIDAFLAGRGEEVAVARAYAKAYELPEPSLDDMRDVLKAVGARREGEALAQWHDRIRSATDDAIERRLIREAGELPRRGDEPDEAIYHAGRDSFELTDDFEPQSRFPRRDGGESGAAGSGAPEGLPDRRAVADVVAAQGKAEQHQRIDAELDQLLKSDPERTIAVSTGDGDSVRMVKVRDLIEEARKQERDAAAIDACASGGIPF